MKKLSLIFILLCFFSFLYPQTEQTKQINKSLTVNNENNKDQLSSIGNFYIQNKNVVYRNIFPVDKVSDSVLKNKILANIIPANKIIDIEIQDNIIIGRINELGIDYKKYAEKWSRSWTLLNHPMNAYIYISVKDNVYRVIISSIEFHFEQGNIDFSLTNSSTTKDLLYFNDKNIIVNGIGYLDKFLSESFTLTPEQLNDNW